MNIVFVRSLSVRLLWRFLVAYLEVLSRISVSEEGLRGNYFESCLLFQAEQDWVSVLRNPLEISRLYNGKDIYLVEIGTSTTDS